ncbi:MAG TPA: DNA polymerase III subunit delta' [Usitatibacteraceae bacterium]|nr:DNA polymerase III subunit delta' [Usitatibacteraceae bacterium]
MSDPILPWHAAAVERLLARREAMPHALLVLGREGIGKVEFARGFGKALLCEAGGSRACGQCAACRWFDEGNHPDYRELFPDAQAEDSAADGEPAGEAPGEKKSREIRIEQVRDLSDFMTLSTHRDGFRVLVVHPAEAMNSAAANAFLKTLEEPPPRTVIVMVAERAGRLLATIRSRCQRLVLPAPEAREAETWLAAAGIADAATLLAQAGGAPLLALQMASAEQQEARRRFLATLAEREPDLLACAQGFEKAELVQLVGWMQCWVADLVTTRMAGSARFNPDRQEALQAIARRLDPLRLLSFEAGLRRMRRHATHPLNARLFVEQLLISYFQAITAQAAHR